MTRQDAVVVPAVRLGLAAGYYDGLQLLVPKQYTACKPSIDAVGGSESQQEVI